MAYVKEISVLRKVTRQTNNGFVHAEASMVVGFSENDELSTADAFEMAWNRVNQEVMDQMGINDTVTK